MNQRYRRVYTLTENLYAEGAPVMIAAGTLLKDTLTDKIVAQLKFRSLSNRAILAVKVKLDLFDTAGIPMGEPIRYEYLDLFATRNTEFGQKVPVHLPDNRVRMYRACVTEVVFADRSVWTATDAPWEPLSKPSFLAIQDPELFNRYRKRFGQRANYVAKEEKDLWICTCGEWNRKGEDCLICQNTLVDLQSVDLGEWIAEKIARLEAKRLQELARKEAEERAAAEKAAAEREAAERAAAEKAAAEKEAVERAAVEKAAAEKTAADKAEKKKAAAKARKAKIRNFLFFLVIAGVIAALIYLSDIPIVNSYESATDLMEAGKYDNAIAVFEGLNDCDDKEESIGECLAGIAQEEPDRVTQELESISYRANNVTVYRVDLQLMDNGYALFTFKFKAEENLSVDFFSPHHENVLFHHFSEETTGAPQTLHYAVKANTLQDLSCELFLNFGNSNDTFIAIWFPYAYDDLTQSMQPIADYDLGLRLMEEGRYEEAIPYFEASLPDYNNNRTDHEDAHEKISQCLLAVSQTYPEWILREKSFVPGTNGDVTAYGVTVQLMGNGYVLISIDLEAEPGLYACFFDAPGGNTFQHIRWSVTTGERETLYFPVKAEDLESVDSISMSLWSREGTADDTDWVWLDEVITIID